MTALTRLETIALGLNEFKGKKSVSLTISPSELSELCLELKEEYEDTEEVVKGVIELCKAQTNLQESLTFRGITFYFSIV